MDILWGGSVTGGLVGGGGSIVIDIRPDRVSVEAVKRKLKNGQGRITPATAKATRGVGNIVMAYAMRFSPQGAGGDWARGNPTLREGHSVKYFNPYHVEVINTASHAPWIHEGFTPHMPPAEAWLGDVAEGFFPRMAVLHAGTPVAPRPWMQQAAAAAAPMLQKHAADIGQSVADGFASG
jgi:hypothetical protein